MTNSETPSPSRSAARIKLAPADRDGHAVPLDDVLRHEAHAAPHHEHPGGPHEVAEQAAAADEADGRQISCAPATTALRRCNDPGLHERDACRRVLDLLGVAEVETRGSACHWEGDLRLVINSRAVLWDGEVVARIDGGAIVPEDVVDHRIPALTPLAAAWAKDPPLGEEARFGDDSASPLLIAADRDLPIGVIHDVLYTATRAGVRDLALVDSALDILPIQRPQPLPVPTEPLTIDAGSVHLQLPSGETRAIAVDAAESIGELARQALAGESHPTAVLVRVAPTSPVGDVLGVLAAVGPVCRMDRDRGFARTILDQEPPIPPRPGRWDDVEAHLGSIELDPRAPGSMTQTGLRAQLEPRLPDLSECLRESDILREVMPDRLWTRVGAENGETVVEIESDDPNIPSYLLPGCIYPSIGLGPPWEHIVGGDAVVRFDLVIPVVDAPAPSHGTIASTDGSTSGR